MSDENASKPEQDGKVHETDAVAISKSIKSVLDVITALGKLALVFVLLIWLWTNRTTVEGYAAQWLDGANKLGFLGLSIERQATATETINAIARSKSAVINAADARGAVTRAARNAAAIVGARVLWVDDAPDNNKLEQEVLEAIGIEVFSAKDTKEALMLLPVIKPDIIISDVDRPADQVQPLLKCPAHYFEMPSKAKGDLATLNKDLLEGRSKAATGFSLAEAISAVAPEYTIHATPRIIFYSGSTGAYSTSQCARLVTNRTDVMLHGVVSALEERRWEKLKNQRAAPDAKQ